MNYSSDESVNIFIKGEELPRTTNCGITIIIEDIFFKREVMTDVFRNKKQADVLLRTRHRIEDYKFLVDPDFEVLWYYMHKTRNYFFLDQKCEPCSEIYKVMANNIRQVPQKFYRKIEYACICHNLDALEYMFKHRFYTHDLKYYSKNLEAFKIYLKYNNDYDNNILRNITELEHFKLIEDKIDIHTALDKLLYCNKPSVELIRYVIKKGGKVSNITCIAETYMDISSKLMNELIDATIIYEGCIECVLFEFECGYEFAEQMIKQLLAKGANPKELEHDSEYLYLIQGRLTKNAYS